MNKNAKTVRELALAFQSNCERIGEIADLCAKENRARTDAETAEYEKLSRDNMIIEMQLRSKADIVKAENPNIVRDVDKIIRENVENKRQTTIKLVRSVMLVSDVKDAAEEAYIPINVQEFLKPLEEGVILSQLPGLRLMTGLAGDFVWPTYENVEATILDEGEALADTQITLGQLKATYNRVGLAIPVSRETINDTHGVIETIIRELMPKALALLMNKVTLSPSVINEKATGLIGPFAVIAEKEKTKAGTIKALHKVPTFAELNAMKAEVLASGVDGENLCWVMSKSMEALLEGEPINSKGIFKPIAENHKACGLPIFTSHYINHDQASEETKEITVNGEKKNVNLDSGTEYIGLGDWRYMPQALFGTIDFVVDPYTLTRKHAVDFVLNANPGIKVLRPEAFKLGKCITANA